MQIRYAFWLVRKWLWFILLTALLGGAVGLAVNLFQPKLYESTTTLYISSPNQSDYQSVLGAQQAAKAFALFPQSDNVLEEAIHSTNISNLNIIQLSSMVTVENTLNSQFVVIRVRYSDPMQATQLAAAIADQSIKFYSTSQNGFRTTILDRAEVPRAPVGLGPTVALAIGSLVGLLVTLCVILFIEQTSGVLVLRPGDQILVLDQETGLSTQISIRQVSKLEKPGEETSPELIAVKDAPSLEKLEGPETMKLGKVLIPRQANTLTKREASSSDGAHNHKDLQRQKMGEATDRSK